jgi:hypothetical protein
MLIWGNIIRLFLEYNMRTQNNTTEKNYYDLSKTKFISIIDSTISSLDAWDGWNVQEKYR